MLKIQILLCLALSLAIVNSDHYPLILGAPKVLKGDGLEEAEDILERALDQLASGQGPSYKLLKVYRAMRQVVSGVLYRYEVDLMDDKGDVKDCIVKIFSQAWLQMGITVTFECYGEESVTAKLTSI